MTKSKILFIQKNIYFSKDNFKPKTTFLNPKIFEKIKSKTVLFTKSEFGRNDHFANEALQDSNPSIPCGFFLNNFEAPKFSK